MKKFVYAFLVLFLLISNMAYGNVFDNLVSQIAPKLKPIKGRILKVEGKKLILDKGYEDGLFKNYFVYVYRNEGSFVPLNSNKPVELKEGICFATINKVYDHKSVATITQGIERERKYFFGLGIISNGTREIYGGKPRTGDQWVAGKPSYRIAVITRNPYIYSQIRDKLNSTGRFFVISPDTLQIALVKNRINTLYERDAIRKLANVVDADLVLLVSTVKHEKLKFKLYDGYSGSAIERGSIGIDNKTRMVLNQINVENIPPNNLVASNLRLQPKLTFWESILNKFGLYSPYTRLQMSSSSYKVVLYKNIGYGTTAMFMGKVDDKDGNVILVAQGSKVTAYRFDIDSFDKLFSFKYGYNIINIDAAKVNGKYLVAISNFDRYGNLSSALGYIDKGKFHIIKDDLPYHIRFFDRFSKKPMLIAQKASIKSPFYGPIYKLDLNTFATTKLDLPVDVNSFYNFYKVGNDIVFVNSSRELEIYNEIEGKITYKAPYIFGGGERAIERYPEPINVSVRQAGYTPEYRLKYSVFIPKSIEVLKTKDGYEVLGMRNYLSHNITINEQHYQGYNIKVFKLNGDKLKLVWSSGDVKGRLVAFGRDGDYIISVIGLPASFFYRFIEGILEVDRLTAARIEY